MVFRRSLAAQATASQVGIVLDLYSKTHMSRRQIAESAGLTKGQVDGLIQRAIHAKRIEVRGEGAVRAGLPRKALSAPVKLKPPKVLPRRPGHPVAAVKAGECRFISGDVRDATWDFCRAKIAVEGASYCPYHMEVCYERKGTDAGPTVERKQAGDNQA